MADFDVSQLSPDQLNSILELGGLDEEGEDLTAQLQRALAMQQPSNARHTTAAGALIAGLGDLLNLGVGTSKESQVRQQQQALGAKRLQGRKGFAGLLGFPGGDGPVMPAPLVPSDVPWGK